jgi:hypothetical protein
MLQLNTKGRERASITECIPNVSKEHVVGKEHENGLQDT